ncbi:MAG TPA: hypothetical protein EYG85_10240 [Crocinitomix sp.]|nr:hypothetical protein [Crocinitomix sp.]
MKKRRMMLLLLGLIISISVKAQKPTIAVSFPNVDNIESLTSKNAATHIRLELIKLDKYIVLDEFDMAEVLKGNTNYQQDCYGLNCLTQLGNELDVDYIISGNFVGLGDKFAISLKLVDVRNKKLSKSVIREFEAYENQISKMVRVLLQEMYGMEVEKLLLDQIKYQDDVITSDNVGKINNSGPRVGGAYLLGSLNEFAIRPEEQGGLDIQPILSMIGYQIEGQYVGTENFSALLEGIINFSGLEQGVFIPSLSILNGFRFGKAGWEFAFGPSFSFRKTSYGFFDTENTFGKGENYYFSENDWSSYAYETYQSDSTYYDTFGGYNPPSITDVSNYSFSKNFDKRGLVGINTTWVMAFGRTFRAGALNIPVNVFYSSTRKGGMLGLSVGFNVMNSKKSIH